MCLGWLKLWVVICAGTLTGLKDEFIFSTATDLDSARFFMLSFCGTLRAT